jgi:uncharacterized protein (DUF433 family)
MELKQALINLGFEKDEVRSIIIEMKNKVIKGADPEELLYDYGLEPDYVFEILPY